MWFLNLGTADILDYNTLWGHFPGALWERLSTIPGLYPLDASRPHSCDNHKYLSITKCPLLEGGDRGLNPPLLPPPVEPLLHIKLFFFFFFDVFTYD